MKRWISVIAVIAMLAALLCACGDGSEKTDADADGAKPLADVFADMKAKYAIDDLMELKDTAALKRFYGIAAEDVADFAGGMNNSGVDQEEIVMILASDASAAERIATALTNRLDSKLSQNKDYNPEQYAIIKDCTVDTDGKYVSLFISEDADAMKADYKAAVGIE